MLDVGCWMFFIDSRVQRANCIGEFSPLLTIILPKTVDKHPELEANFRTRSENQKGL